MALHDVEYKKCVAFLRDQRGVRRVTQQELAERLGKPQSFVSKIERGDRRLDVVEFVRVAKALGIPLKDAFKALGWK